MRLPLSKLTPYQILRDPLLNKGTAFTLEERTNLGLHGLLPSHVSTIEEQLQRRYQNFLSMKRGINRYIFLKNLQDRNEVLFYRLALEHAAEMLPYIYTPVVGDASLDYSNIYVENRGLYISYEFKDQIDALLSSHDYEDVDVIVVTDGSRILGLGDVGIGGMTIPIGKLSLYTLFGGIHPEKTLPILLDVGTDNENLLKDPLYLGARHPRITGKDYDDFIERFVQAVKKKYPKVLLQWEDFSKNHARPLLEKYQQKICSFNDDIQGTAAVALSAILAALKSIKQSLKDQKIAILGGGSAGLGIAEYLLASMKLDGLSEKEALSRFFIVDMPGLIHSDLEKIDSHQRKFAQDSSSLASWKVQKKDHITLEEVIANGKPTILLGASTQPNVFTKTIVETMSSYCQRPIIFPLSNPTAKSEAEPANLIEWSQGRAIVATGSPFPPVQYEGRDYPIGQCNNVYIFPGVGLGIIASKAETVSDEMFLKAAATLSDHSPILKDPRASTFPKIEDLREISRKIGIEVAKLAFKQGVARSKASDIEKLIDETIWFPKYAPLKK